MGLEILDHTQVASDHRASLDAVRDYLTTCAPDPTVGGVLILDALTMHEPELNRIDRTLR
jgi:hypothetical protein